MFRSEAVDALKSDVVPGTLEAETGIAQPHHDAQLPRVELG